MSVFASALLTVKQSPHLPLGLESVWDSLAVGVCLTIVAHSQGCQQCEGAGGPSGCPGRPLLRAVWNKARLHPLTALERLLSSQEMP